LPIAERALRFSRLKSAEIAIARSRVATEWIVASRIAFQS
jgi:hypothetical protein